jgi:hypothetical protein
MMGANLNDLAIKISLKDKELTPNDILSTIETLLEIGVDKNIILRCQNIGQLKAVGVYHGIINKDKTIESDLTFEQLEEDIRKRSIEYMRNTTPYNIEVAEASGFSSGVFWTLKKLSKLGLLKVNEE